MDILRSVLIFNSTTDPYNYHLIFMYTHEKQHTLFWAKLLVVFVHSFQDFYIMLLNSVHFFPSKEKCANESSF